MLCKITVITFTITHHKVLIIENVKQHVCLPLPVNCRSLIASVIRLIISQCFLNISWCCFHSTKIPQRAANVNIDWTW